ncbi:M20 family metallopeptidase [Desulfogranum marinum]|uniref:M20 family metallopeptidase n=1 Tax=Desulfogranum marinum TaxID=453220 RepID=UPI001964C76C|nr:M20 family metallopeptidase [Desulfogranum marinum]MBM9512040.1 M20 family metallopeptidase [Desulfogranum marinum]
MPHTLAFSLAQNLVRINTVNPPGNETDAVRVLAPLLKEAGFSIKEYQYGPNRSSLVAHRGRLNQPAVILSGHLDTVPFGAQPWKRPPQSGEVHDNKLYGRGSADMKGGVAVLVAAAIHFAAKVTDIPITLILSANEEIGCGGVSRLIQEQVLPQARCVLVAEPTGNVPCLGHKGVLWVKATFHGTTAHAAFPHLGDNALLKAAQAVVTLNNGIVSGYSHPAMGEPTLVTSKLASGDNYNSVPDRAELGIDSRSTIALPNDAILSKIKTLLAHLDAELETIFNLPPLWTDPELDIVKSVIDCCDLIRGCRHESHIAPFYTDGGLLGPGLGGVPVIILGPGESGMAHQVNEHVAIADLREGLDIYLEILSRLCC